MRENEITVRALVKITGAVQGVGFRPFVYRLARIHSLSGWVANDADAVVVDVEGDNAALKRFIEELCQRPPPLAVVAGIEMRYADEAAGIDGFEIRYSTGAGTGAAHILPDAAVCAACYAELTDPADRRYRYPFINCTECGPRFGILEKLPYDRQNTSMRVFKMCPQCLAEYENPENRRFHAQPNACAECGPRVFFLDSKAVSLSADKAPDVADRARLDGERAIGAALKILQSGGILAVKGVGGFHLACDATNEAGVALLRRRKGREQKPLAVMFKNLDEIRDNAEITAAQETLLKSTARPIVVLQRRVKPSCGRTPVPTSSDLIARPLACCVSPGLDTLGAFLPPTPLHHLIINDAGGPLVMTSANLSGCPIIKDNTQALDTLRHVADGFLMHDRAIVNHSDDSLLEIISGAPAFLRRSRGFAPLSLPLPFDPGQRVLALGAMQKNTIALAAGGRAVIGQHIGDLDTVDASQRYEEVLERLMELYGFTPETVVYDMHPGYYQSRAVVPRFRAMGVETVGVYHHHAHALSVMADNLVGLHEQVLAVTWDGTGYGWDGCVWGGEFLLAGYSDFQRVFHFDYFRLIGGEHAVKEPRRSALALLFGLYGEDAFKMNVESLTGFSQAQLRALHRAWRAGINSPETSSAGRLFDAAACLLGLLKISSYEGQAGMLMEQIYDPTVRDFYPYEIKDSKIFWQPIIEGLLKDGGDTVVRASRFINTLAEAAVEVVKRSGLRGAISGGVFQNGALVARIMKTASRRAVSIFAHRQAPANDGGISLGQLAAVRFR
jgi:hydrogenase maturation protein HypF